MSYLFCRNVNNIATIPRIISGVENLHAQRYKKSIKIVVGSPEGNRLFGRLRHRLKDNIKI